MIAAQKSLITLQRAILIALAIIAIFFTRQSVAAAPQTSLELTVTADQSSVLVGQSVNYRIIILNTGVDPAERISVVPILPVEFVYANGAVPRFLSDLGSLDPGEKIQQDVLARIPTDTKPGRYNFTTFARAANASSVKSVVGVDVKIPSVLGVSDTNPQKNINVYIYFGLGLVIFSGLLAWIKLRPARKARVV